MATQSKQTAEPAVEQITERVKELNERALETQRKLGKVYLDAAERTLANLAEVQDRVAAATPVEAGADLVKLQANLTRQIADAYVTAGRELLD